MVDTDTSLPVCVSQLDGDVAGCCPSAPSTAARQCRKPRLARVLAHA